MLYHSFLLSIYFPPADPIDKASKPNSIDMLTVVTFHALTLWHEKPAESLAKSVSG